MRELELYDRVLTKILADRAEDTPDAPFIDVDGESYSYGLFYERSMAMAQALAALGAGRGSRVVTMLPNRIESLLSWFGAALVGATVVPINPEWKGDTLVYILTDAAPFVVVLDDDDKLIERVTPVLEALPDLEAVVTCGEIDLGSALLKDRVLTWEGLVARGHNAVLPPGPRFDDVLAILYSSGTTGRPKGIVMPHAHVYSFGVQWSNATNLGPDDSLYAPMPLYYMQATVLGIIPTLMNGGRVHIGKRFSASRFWDEVRACRATIAHTQFSLIPILLKQPPNPLDRQHDCTRVFIGMACKFLPSRSELFLTTAAAASRIVCVER